MEIKMQGVQLDSHALREEVLAKLEFAKEELTQIGRGLAEERLSIDSKLA